MRYFAKFNKQGERETSIAEGIHFVNDDELKNYTNNGFIEISEEDQELYATNEYIRDPATGKPILRPPYIPTTEDKTNAVATEYSLRIAELKDVLATATLAGDDETVAELRNEYADLMAEYQAALEVIGNDEAL